MTMGRMLTTDGNSKIIKRRGQSGDEMEVSWDECRQIKVDCTNSEAGPTKMYKDFDN